MTLLTAAKIPSSHSASCGSLHSSAISDVNLLTSSAGNLSTNVE
ncbi:hypothetical protein [Lysobacter gummosus]